MNSVVTSYVPRVGDWVVARRKVRSDVGPNLLVGHVMEVGVVSCRILTNPGTETAGDFRLCFCGWDFRFVVKSDLTALRYWSDYLRERENGS